MAAELATLRPGGPPAIPAVLAALRETLDVESAVVYSVAQRAIGWEVDRWDAAGAVGTNDVRRHADALFASETRDPVLYDPLRPAADIRDRVFEAGAWLEAATPGAWQRSRMYREVFAPCGMHEHRQLRALVCEGPVMLGWFGVVHPEATTARHERILTALMPAMRRRLAIERRLAGAARHAATLDVALEQLGAAAFVVSATGAIRETNALGRALVESCRADVHAALADALAGRAHAMVFELTPIVDLGVPAASLAILRAAPRDVRLAAAVGAAAEAWKLTPRQRQVLALVVDGHANATIAALLHISARTVELHMTALLDRAGVDGRAGLVAHVLTR